MCDMKKAPAQKSPRRKSPGRKQNGPARPAAKGTGAKPAAKTGRAGTPAAVKPKAARKTVRLKSGRRAIDDSMLPRGTRLATAADAVPLTVLERRSFDERRYGGAMMSLRAARHFIGGANALMIVAEKGGRIAGYALVMFRQPGLLARFYSLAVDPNFQGQGIGTILFAAVEKIAGKAGAAELLLEIRADNDVLKKRYGAMGYRVYRTVPDYYADGCAALKMRRAV